VFRTAGNSLGAPVSVMMPVMLDETRGEWAAEGGVLVPDAFSVFIIAYNPWRSLLRATHPFFVYSNGELYRFTSYLVLNSKAVNLYVDTLCSLFFGVIVPPNATNASRRLNRLLVSKGVETKASIAANSSSIRQSTSATTINRDLPQPKLNL